MDSRITDRQPGGPTSLDPGQVEDVVVSASIQPKPAMGQMGDPTLLQPEPVLESLAAIAAWERTSGNQPIFTSADHREQLLVKREADLQARRRDAAREIRRQRRETNQLDKRLAGMQSVLAELTHVIVQFGEQGPANASGIGRVEPDSIVEESLRDEIQALRSEIETLTTQNEQLAGDLAHSLIRKSISNSSDADATMTWDQRKAKIFAQDLPEPCHVESRDSAEQLGALDRLRNEIQARDTEIAQLRDLLEQRPSQCEQGTTVGAAAIAQLMDDDELVREERQRLQDLQTEWESKFRKMEIAASIERANISRERQQLERQNADLEEQLAHLKRELRQEEITGPNQSRRWLAKLGLAD